MEFVETSVFTKLIQRLLGEDEYADFQVMLACNPQAGRLIPGGGGLRKSRWSHTQRGKGKRGGIRIIYYVHSKDRLYMIYVYDKDRQEDLTNKQLKILREYVKAGVL